MSNVPLRIALNSAAVRIKTSGRFDDNENFNTKSELQLEFELNKSEFTQKSAVEYETLTGDPNIKGYKGFSKYYCLAYVDESTKKFNCGSR
jgi:hypothetical protein